MRAKFVRSIVTLLLLSLCPLGPVGYADFKVVKEGWILKFNVPVEIYHMHKKAGRVNVKLSVNNDDGDRMAFLSKSIMLNSSGGTTEMLHFYVYPEDILPEWDPAAAQSYKVEISFTDALHDKWTVHPDDDVWWVKPDPDAKKLIEYSGLIEPSAVKYKYIDIGFLKKK